jgi:hypothetical protein
MIRWRLLGILTLGALLLTAIGATRGLGRARWSSAEDSTQSGDCDDVGADSASADTAPAEESDGEDDSGGFIDPLGPNAACYVCHLTFVREEISKVHLAEEIGCIECHGVSAAHANDEDIGATPPDTMYKRHEVDPACAKCHETHDAPASEVVGRFLDRKLPADPSPICTDCHGRHRIDRAAEAL